MNIAILGTSANPIHNGHTAIAKQLILMGWDEIWIMPCHNHTLKSGLNSSLIRLEMASLAVQDLDQIKISDFEVKNEFNNGTYEMLCNLSSIYSQHKFYFVIGQDNANSINLWRNYEKLIDEYSFIVVPRQGTLSESPWYNRDQDKPLFQRKHIYLKDFVPPNISSTMIRRKVQNNESVDDLIHPDVNKYIQVNNLYK